jgi:membrane protease subunit HflC
MTYASRLFRSPIGWAMLLVLVVLACASVFTIVPETEQALVVRLGKPDRIVNRYRAIEAFGGAGAGLIAHIPLIDEVYFIDKRVRDLDLDRQPILSADQRRIDVDAVARYRIVDPMRMYLAAAGDEQRVDEALKPALGSALRDRLGRMSFAALLTPERDAALVDVRTALDRTAARYGVRVVDVRIPQTSLPEGALLNAAFDKMKAARKQQAIAILTDGSKDAQLIKAQADADSARIYADAYNQDPDFYDYYRSMQSYRATFGVDGAVDGSTVMVLSPDSEYFRNFKGAAH